MVAEIHEGDLVVVTEDIAYSYERDADGNGEPDCTLHRDLQGRVRQISAEGHALVRFPAPHLDKWVLQEDIYLLKAVVDTERAPYADHGEPSAVPLVPAALPEPVTPAPRLSNPAQFVPVAFLSCTIAFLYCVYVFCHCLPLMQLKEQPDMVDHDARLRGTVSLVVFSVAPPWAGRRISKAISECDPGIFIRTLRRCISEVMSECVILEPAANLEDPEQLSKELEDQRVRAAEMREDEGDLRKRLAPSASRGAILLSALAGDIANIHAAVSPGPPAQATGVSEAISESSRLSAKRGYPGLPRRQETKAAWERSGEMCKAMKFARRHGGCFWSADATDKIEKETFQQPRAAKDYEKFDLRGCIDGPQRLATRPAAEVREMNHVASDLFFVPVSNWAFRKSSAAGQNYGNQFSERGRGRKLGPTAVAVSIDRAPGALTDFLELAGDNGERSQAMVTETINGCNVSGSHKARNKKNRNPGEDEQEFWEEGPGNIPIGINGPPNFRAALPKGTKEGAIAKLGQFASHNLRMAVGILVVYIGGKKSQSAAPMSKLERKAQGPDGR
ncbi:unnamed protein product [Prorocentrum cordatum]|uniref:RING-type E3 ubiquitin transferase n=1 Tax=Prorocentrum cordatum TaxID=2364126 RepID=A0ABN9VL92_9DINO|nr:unnamed protein product [Polarella glacialis]